MKNKSLTLITLLAAFFATNVQAVAPKLAILTATINPYSTNSVQAEVESFKMDDTWSWFLVSLLFMLTLVIALLVILQIKLNNYIEKERAQQSNPDEFVERATWWELFTKPEKNRPLDLPIEGHDYDGIVELDNNPPAWFNWLFFLPIGWGLFYILYYYVFSIGALPEEEYATAMKEHEILLAQVEERRANDIENLVPFTDAVDITKGQELYMANCKACHGDNGQSTKGGVGPNLTDDYWLHGGDFKDIYQTIYKGVDGKGMAAWGKVLKFKEVVQVASYVETLKGKNLEGGKEPQGDLYK